MTEAKDNSNRTIAVALVVAVLGAVLWYVAATWPDSYDRAARVEWEKQSRSEQVDLCDTFESNPEFFGTGPSADAIRDLLKKEC